MNLTADTIDQELEPYRRELTAYCYRMLGAGSEAEDAVQETFIRAWKNIDRFEGRSTLRSWLYRIATNVCLDMARGPQRRARPMDLGPSQSADSTLGPLVPEHHWVQPVADAKVLPTDSDPAELAATRESIRLAFVAALQQLPPRQRAVLILREVLRWQASEVAELLGTTVVSVNSALQRARSSLETADLDSFRPGEVDAEQQEMLAKYLDAFERYDVNELVTLLHEDATMSMPPYELWLQGTDEIAKWFIGTGSVCRNSRLLPTSANGCPAFALYHVDPDDPNVHHPWSIQVLQIEDGLITGFHSFLYPELFPYFGLPTKLER
ncbi:MAG TPA: sigma-70 family RNA polymerase sigma factor [Acidimicrobiales bacterium]